LWCKNWEKSLLRTGFMGFEAQDIVVWVLDNLLLIEKAVISGICGR
jgi:hypothetical protein